MAGVYIHIPFCKKKCIYCDFFSVAGTPESLSGYADAVGREYEFRQDELGDAPLQTVYFGGGTPSVMPVAEIGKMLGGLRRVAADAEITMEVNPDDVTPELASAVRSAGVNRISMGVQSFSDRELLFLRRRHDAAGALKAVETLGKAGFDNISIDLIYGIPGQSMESWNSTLQTAMSLSLPHLSSYCLTYEEGTRLTQMRDRGDFEVCDDDMCVAMYERLADVVAGNGYEQYEISNYCKPEMYSRHNSAYWDFTPYIGLGAAAHSFDGRVRRYNPSGLRAYLEGVATDGRAYSEEEETADQLYNEWVMTRLRTKWGMDMENLRYRFGRERAAYAERVVDGFVAEGCLERRGQIVRLTRKGVMLSDSIFRDLFIVE